MKEFESFMRKGDDTGFAVLGCLILLTALAAVAGFFLWLVASANALAACRRRNREMDPAAVWLCLVPGFGLVWVYFVAVRTAASLRREYRARGWRTGDTDFGRSLGVAACVVAQAGWATWWLIVGVPAVVVGVALEFVLASRLWRHSSRLSDGDGR